jgi:hypothetical protein
MIEDDEPKLVGVERARLAGHQPPADEAVEAVDRLGAASIWVGILPRWLLSGASMSERRMCAPWISSVSPSMMLARLARWAEKAGPVSARSSKAAAP